MLQDQIKLGGFTLVLSGRNDWVSTNQATIRSARRCTSREDSKFSGRAGLIYNFDSTALRPTSPTRPATIRSSASIPRRISCSCRKPGAGRGRIEVPAAGFNGHFSIAVFDLKRQNVPTTDPLASLTASEPDRRESPRAVSNLRPSPIRARAQMVGAFTTYDLFISKDANPALIGQTPTNTPQQTELALGRLHASRRGR